MRRVAALVLALSCLLAGCAPGDGAAGVARGAAAVQVDTPRLRAMKRAAGVEACRPGDGEAVAGGLPALTLPCLGGGPAVDLAALRGPMVVSLWASWCTSCRREMPNLQAFHEDHGDEVPVLGIDYQDVQTESAMALVRRTGVTYPLLADPRGQLDAAAPLPPLRALPFLVILDADGQVVHQEFTVVTSERDLVDLVDRYAGTEL